MNIIEALRAIPKTVYFNFRCLSFAEACKFPFFVSHRVRFKGLRKGCISIQDGEIRPFMVRLGISDGSYEKGKYKRSLLQFRKDAHIRFCGEAHIANEFHIDMCGGTLIFGNDFSSNNGLTISCNQKIEFGANCLLGWNCTFIDGDGHQLLDQEKKRINMDSPIQVGNRVWISAEVSCLKGTRIPDNCVVGFRSVVSHAFEEQKCLLTGIPARAVKMDIDWKH